MSHIGIAWWPQSSLHVCQQGKSTLSYVTLVLHEDVLNQQDPWLCEPNGYFAFPECSAYGSVSSGWPGYHYRNKASGLPFILLALWTPWTLFNWFFNFILNILWTCVELLKSLYLKGIWGTINTILPLYFDMLGKQDLPRIHCHMLNHFFSNLQTNKTEGHMLWVYILFLLRCAQWMRPLCYNNKVLHKKTN